ncbi:hypothetical protein Tco_0158328 [Tanacetum coccineum]
MFKPGSEWSNPGTMASSIDPVAQSSPGSQSAPNVALKDKVRGRGKIWDEKETQVRGHGRLMVVLEAIT